MRRGETLALRWTDVDLDAGTVAVLGSLQRVGNQLQRVPTKTHGFLRTIPLPTLCMEALRSHRARHTYSVAFPWSNVARPKGLEPLTF